MKNYFDQRCKIIKMFSSDPRIILKKYYKNMQDNEDY
jgi:hypothetical protein